MTQLLFAGEWFRQISPSALYEAEFQRIVLQQAEILFPGFVYAPFSAIVFSDTSSARPDAALIARDYSHWWVVEIEMTDHSLEGHVVPQVETLAQGYFTREHAEAISAKCPSIDASRLADMVRGKPPRVLVIVNGHVPGWADLLRRYDARIITVEVYRSDMNKSVLKVDGDLPSSLPDKLCECRFDRLVPGFLLLDAPAVIGLPQHGKIRIRYRGYLTEWRRIAVSDRVWLVPVGANPLPTNMRYAIYVDGDGQLTIRAQT